MHRGRRHVERTQQRKTFLDHMGRRTGVGRVGVEESRLRLPEMRARQADGPFCADHARQHGGFQETLQIDDGIVADAPPFAEHGPRADTSREIPSVEGNAPVDTVDELEQLDVSRIDHPVETRLREVVAESSRRWNAVDDIAERSETDDEKRLHGALSPGLSVPPGPLRGTRPTPDRFSIRRRAEASACA